MSFPTDYPGAIVVEAANYGYGVANRPKTWGFHTPEEPADTYPSTPDYLATTDRDASYTYFVSYLGFVFQLVPEREGAYANALEGKPAPPWSDGTNLNLQTLSVSFEGYAATIHQTMPRGSPQWVAGVNLVAHRTKALELNLDWAFQHKQVSIYRGDCGAWDQAAFVADVKIKMAEMEGEDMLRLIQAPNRPVCVTDGIYKWPLPSGARRQELEDKGLVKPGVIILSADAYNRIKMTHEHDLKDVLIAIADIQSSTGSGLTEAQMEVLLKRLKLVVD